MELILTNGVLTMTSLELVAFINDLKNPLECDNLTHSNFMAKVPKVLGKMGLIQMNDTYIHPQNGQTYPMYRFPKREACLMAMSYSYDIQAKIFDRWQELEEKLRKPKTPLELAKEQVALYEALEAKEKELEKQKILIEAQKPAVEFVEKYVDAKTTKCISDVAKLLKVGRDAFFKFLSDEKIIFKRGNTWLPFSTYDQYFEVKADEVNGVAIMTTRFNAKGISWIAGRYASKTISQKVLI